MHAELTLGLSANESERVLLYLMTISQAHQLHFIEWYDDLNDELERIWKEAIVDYFMELYKQICLVFGYWLDDRAIEVRSAAEAKGIFLQPLCPDRLWGPVQWVPGVLSPGLKHGRGVSLTTHPHLVPRSRVITSYTSSPQAPSWRVVGLVM
jgi:hypothetical protein